MPGNIEGPEQEALFKIEGPDEDGCVWVCSSAGREVWCHNLGPQGKVTEAFVAKLSEWDYGERPEDWTGAKEVDA